MKPAGLKAIVTGGASGLGLACAQSFAARGAQVWIADKDDKNAHKVTKDGAISFVQTDVTSEDDVLSLLDKVSQGGEPARVLVNCAGIAPALSLWRNDIMHCLDAFEYVMRTNVLGTFLMASRFAYQLRAAEPIGEETGVVINVSSIAAFDGQAERTAYAASKGAVASMTLPLARELAKYGIRAACIAPGLFDTPMLHGPTVLRSADRGTQAPHPSRLGHPEEFASLAAHIVENPMINGEVIRLDGALRTTPW